MQEYTITLPDGMETTVLLSDEDAKARGLTAEKPAAGKAKTPPNKQAAPANKAATAANKGDG
jgi:hypothetical protein